MTPKGRTLWTASVTRLERSERRAQGTVRVAPYWQGGCTACGHQLPTVGQRLRKLHALDLVERDLVLEDLHRSA